LAVVVLFAKSQEAPASSILHIVPKKLIKEATYMFGLCTVRRSIKIVIFGRQAIGIAKDFNFN
jgi:hypothetical protein